MIRAGIRGVLAMALGLGMPLVAMAAGTAAVVYRDPSCGCCHAWVSYLRDHGFDVSVRENEPMPAVKARLGVPMALASCHTAQIGRYVIEGHVPVEDIRRLLAERPDARGLAAPGMPMGSPGMEMGPAQPYDVLLIEGDGSSRLFAHHGSRSSGSRQGRPFGCPCAGRLADPARLATMVLDVWDTDGRLLPMPPR